MSQPKGFLNIVLHAHLPFVCHPEYKHFFEENWLFEAITECYIPLLQMLTRLSQEQVKYRLTLSLSPPLMAMLNNELLQTRYLAHLHKQIELAEKEVIRTQGTAYHDLAKFYRQLYVDTRNIYQAQYGCDILSVVQALQASGHLELISSAATHGFLPLLNSEAAVRCQIETGIASFATQFGLQPAGFWLPECAYYPGLENHLQRAGVQYFFVDAHGVEHAGTRPRYGVYAPLDCGNAVLAFARHPACSQQVWSAGTGYPGDALYREYHSDIGFELDLDYLAPYILDEHVRINTGIKYHRVTGDNLPKALYQPQQAAAKARLHAEDFINQCRQHMAQQAENMDRPPIITTPFDAELFGHWWFEGPQWLEWVLRLAASDAGLQTGTGSDYTQHCTQHQVATPSASTWGEQGYSKHWLNANNDWIYPLLQQAAADLEKLVRALQGSYVNPLQERALNQALRSLLLAQASDWPFILQTGTTVAYAKKRLNDHLARFHYLLESVQTNAINARYLSALEILDDIFPAIDFRDFQAPI